MLLNNYKYSDNIQENIDITVNNFNTNEKQDLISFINNVKNDIYSLPDLMKYINYVIINWH